MEGLEIDYIDMVVEALVGVVRIQKAAGKVHSDFEKGFIKAEVMKYSDLEKYNSEHELREHGLVVIHGRDYLVQDGDVVFFRFKT